MAIKSAGDYPSLEKLANRVRKHVIEMTHRGKSSHVGTSFSMIELLVVLYEEILNIRPSDPNWEERDRFILSKGHGCAALYAVLAEKGYFPVDWLESYYLDGSPLPGHVTSSVPGVEVSTGSLGHGLSIANGMAITSKRDRAGWRVFTILSDGECDEGSIWEAALFAGNHELDNLTVIVDYNKIQALGYTEDVLNLEPFADKWKSFGWEVREIDGHNLSEVQEILDSVPFISGKPNCIIAHTIKGKGVSFMEGDLLWHYRSPQGSEYEDALKELGSMG
jgi:transketolase